MDRIDMVIQVDRPDPARLLDAPEGEASEHLLGLVTQAREYSQRRCRGPVSALSGTELLDACRLSADTRQVLERTARTQHLSGRGITRLLRVARTIADIEQMDRVVAEHVAEALGYRAMERG